MPSSPNRRACLAVFGTLFIACLALQWHSGAYRSDFGAHADEAAHVVTGLMVRDYAAGGFVRQPHPLRFAEDYYARFPKVAIGHYPPLFYLVEGAWLLPFRGQAGVLVFMALLAATGAFLTWRAARHLIPPAGSMAAALFFCLLPLVRTYTAIVMSDLLLVICCLGAAMAFSRFLERGKARDSILFGTLAAAAMLTKGAGLFLALVPPIAIMLTRKWHLLRTWRLWAATIPVLLLAFPWFLLTRSITAEGMRDTSVAEYLPAAVQYYAGALWREFGIVVLIALVVAIVAAAARMRKEKRGLSPPLAVHVGSLIGLVVFFCVIPSGLDGRYLLPVVPAVAIITFSICPRGIPAAVVFAVLCLLPTHRPVTKLYTGASQTIQAIRTGTDRASSEDANVRVLVSSGPRGEGALVAAAALLERGGLEVLRASKTLATSDWLGRGYGSKFETENDLADFLLASSVDIVVLDRGIPEPQILDHHRLLESTADKHADTFEPPELVASQRKVAGETAFVILRRRQRP